MSLLLNLAGLLHYFLHSGSIVCFLCLLKTFYFRTVKDLQNDLSCVSHLELSILTPYMAIVHLPELADYFDFYLLLSLFIIIN